jgi:hypothetical protein
LLVAVVVRVITVQAEQVAPADQELAEPALDHKITMLRVLRE